MTLCIAWKYEDKICIAADSRFTGESAPIDCGIKVLECPIEIISAIDHSTGNYTVLHQSSVGMAFSGSQLAAYLVKERISELFLKLQYVGALQDLTFSKIADAAFKVYCHAIKTVTGAYEGYGETDFFLVGRCPSTGEPCAFRFWSNNDPNALFQTRILAGNGFQYDPIGAGSERIRERIEARLAKPCQVNFMVLEELREMIVLNEIASVGGAVQYGHIEAGQPFRIFGVMDFRMDGKKIVPMPSSRGIDIEAVIKPQHPDDLYVRESMIDPYRRLMDEAIR